MNKSESKYFATAVRMDEAFLRLLEKKDFAYITVKELCETAGVNRSTFYLHYETMADLLSESAQYMNEQFLTYMNRNTETFVTKMKECPLDELYLVTQEYLTPYLNYIKEHQRLFRTAMEHYVILGWIEAMNKCFAMYLYRYWNGMEYRKRTGIISWRFTFMGLWRLFRNG